MMKKSILLSALAVAVVLPPLASAAAAPCPRPLYQETTTHTPIDTAVPTDTATLEPTAALTDTPTATATVETTSTATATATIVPTATSTTGSYARPLFNLTSYSYDSANTYAGGAFSLTTVLENSGQRSAYNSVITFSSSDMQPLYNGGVQIVETMDRGDSVTLSQSFAVKSSVNSKYSSIAVQADYKDAYGQSYSQNFSLAITIYGYGSYSTATPTATPIGRPHPVVTDYSIDVSSLQPGTNFNLSMNVQNQGAYSAKNVSLTIGGSSSGSTSSSDFLPVGSSNVRVLGDLLANQTVTVRQSFIVNSSTSAGAYALTLLFSYKNESGVDYSEEQVITLLVYKDPIIEISFYEEPGTYTVGEQGNLPIQVVNLSGSSILLGDISLSADNAVLANSQMFVGSIDGGSIFTMDTDFTPQKEGTVTLYVNITYIDNFNNSKVLTTTLTVTVQSASGTGGMAMMGTQSAAGQGTGAGSSAFTGNGNSATPTGWLGILLRILRGLLGLDSAA
jgi:hypothetical protein